MAVRIAEAGRPSTLVAAVACCPVGLRTDLVSDLSIPTLLLFAGCEIGEAQVAAIARALGESKVPTHHRVFEGQVSCGVKGKGCQCE